MMCLPAALASAFKPAAGGGGGSTITYVGGQVGGRVGSTTTSSVTFSLTGGSNTTPQAGDLVVITVVMGSSASRTADQSIADPSGYAALGQLTTTATTYDTTLNVSWKFMGETPDAAFTLPATGDIQDAQRWTVQVFRSVHPTTPFDVAVVPATGTATSRPNPGSITPVSSGAAILICAGGAAGTGVAYTAPSGFATNFLTGFTSDSIDAIVGSGYQLGWASGTVDPDQYTGGSTSTNDSWAAYTIALRPA